MRTFKLFFITIMRIYKDINITLPQTVQHKCGIADVAAVSVESILCLADTLVDCSDFFNIMSHRFLRQNLCGHAERALTGTHCELEKGSLSEASRR